MLEIKSKWDIIVDPELGISNLLTIFFTRDGKTFNLCMNADEFHLDGEATELTISTMLKVLIDESYPEMRNPIYKMKKELANIEKRKETLILAIKSLEETA